MSNTTDTNTSTLPRPRYLRGTAITASCALRRREQLQGVGCRILAEDGTMVAQGYCRGVSEDGAWILVYDRTYNRVDEWPVEMVNW